MVAMEQQDTKTKMLDNNILMLANDLETFQKIMTKINKSIIELQDINKDVLLGKKNTNCLSCSKMNDEFENKQTVLGKDGRQYFSGGGRKNVKTNLSKFGRKKIKNYDDEEEDLTLQTMGLGNSIVLSPGGNNQRGISHDAFSTYKDSVKYENTTRSRVLNQYNSVHKI